MCSRAAESQGGAEKLFFQDSQPPTPWLLWLMEGTQGQAKRARALPPWPGGAPASSLSPLPWAKCLESQWAREWMGQQLALLHCPGSLGCQAGQGNRQSRGPPHFATGGWACPHTSLLPALSCTRQLQHWSSLCSAAPKANVVSNYGLPEKHNENHSTQEWGGGWGVGRDCRDL